LRCPSTPRPAEIEQAVHGIVTCKPRDLRAKHDTDMAERSFSNQARKLAFDHPSSRNYEILVNDKYALSLPSILPFFDS
jgi:hypothetical protein